MLQSDALGMVDCAIPYVPHPFETPSLREPRNDSNVDVEQTDSEGVVGGSQGGGSSVAGLQYEH